MQLRQNSPMSFFEECLTLGQWLDQDLSRALYKFLLAKKKNIYKSDAENLLENGSLNSFVANGEILYAIENNLLKYKSRANGDVEYTDVLRGLKLSKFKILNIFKIMPPVGARRSKVTKGSHVKTSSTREKRIA